LTGIKLSDIIINTNIKNIKMLYQRDVLSKIKKVIDREEFIILMGARQVGKTSLLILLKEFLDKNKKDSYYFNLENREYLNLLNEHPYNIFELLPKSKTKQFVFIDEIQYLDNPTNFLKLLYDEKRNDIKIIASGSSSFYIDNKFKDSLAGRKFLFEIYPLNFYEYIRFNNQEELLKLKNKKLTIWERKKILSLWDNYLLYGAYPKIALTAEEDIKKILLEEIGTAYIKKDIEDAGIKNIDKYFAILKILASQSGQLLNTKELANILGIAHKTVEGYLYVMKKSYQISLIKPFYKNMRKELTKMPKVYLNDLGLRNFFLNNYGTIDKREDKGEYLENIVFREFLLQSDSVEKIKFWRTQDKQEIDFIFNNSAFEVKFNKEKFNYQKYNKFTNFYPEIKLTCLSYADILRYFYKYKI